MRSNFKPLGIAAAVAVASAGYANVASSQPTVANNALGDLALVPYYTVNGEWLTGIHIVNTSDKTQVVKFRFRRKEDSLDALDFNVVMSPKDVYAGYLSADENDVISWEADDTSCTVPATTDGRLEMPEIYNQDGEASTGYVEIIAMAQPTSESELIAIAAKHKNGVPLDCAAVRSNFFANGTSVSDPGHVNTELTWQADGVVDGGPVNYEGSDNALKVSYFIRDNASGIEFGDNAVHIQNFLQFAQMSNQQYGYLSGDLDGFDFPGLDGGVPTGTDGTGTQAERGAFAPLRGAGVLGVTSLINEWTANSANGAALDWVVTMPGQYTMFDRPQYILAATGRFDTAGDPEVCERGDGVGVIGCDNRDIPVQASIRPYNREEGEPDTPEEDLVVSPAPPGTVARLILPNEVNVISFGGNSVLNDTDVDVSADIGQPYGWLSLAVTPAKSYLGGESAVCDWIASQDVDAGFSLAQGEELDMTCEAVGGNVPMIGFAAWARQVAANPDASYGRIVAHSFINSGE